MLTIHLTSAFQLVGFPHVIGTLWPIRDDIAVEAAQSFYSGLRDNGQVHADRAAYALHSAVRALRDSYPGRPALWATYLHAGA
jgi:CHAT domain-containing protein